LVALFWKAGSVLVMLPSADSDDDSSSVLAWAKLAVFGVFHSMRERDSHQRITLASQSWSFFLRLVDALQVILLGRSKVLVPFELVA